MKLVIMIEGVQNSEKTSTILHFVNQYQSRILIVMRSGWKNLYINPLFQMLRVNPYVLSSSPSESGNPLTNRFSSWTALPDLKIMAEQSGGGHQANTLSFLTTNGIQ